MVRLTDRPDLTLDVYRGRKTTMKQRNKKKIRNVHGLHWLLWYKCATLNHNLQIPNFSARCKIYTGYHGTSEIEHGLCACTVDNPLAKARGLSLRTGAQTMLYLSHIELEQNVIPSLLALWLFYRILFVHSFKFLEHLEHIQKQTRLQFSTLLS